MRFYYQYLYSIAFSLLICFTATAQSNYTLQKVLQTARENNPFLKAEQLNISIAETNIVTAKLRPNLNLSSESLQLLKTSEFAKNTSWHNNLNRQVMWQISKPFHIAGQRKNKIEVAGKNLVFSEMEYQDAERQLLLEAGEKWLAVWTSQKQLEVLAIAKENINSVLINNQHRFRNQVLTETDLYRTKLLSKQYAIQYKTTVQEMSNLKKELAFIMGVEEDLKIDTNDSLYMGVSSDLENLIAQALISRSDILAAQKLIEISNSNIQLQKSLAYPQPELGLIWNPQNRTPYFGVSFSVDLPFFDRNQGEIQKSHLVQRQTEQQLSVIENQLQTEIKTAYNSFQLHQQNIADFKSIMEQSQNILENVRYAYLKGGTTIIDFLEAQRAWLETQQQYYETLQQYHQSYIQLLYATGQIHQLTE